MIAASIFLAMAVQTAPAAAATPSAPSFDGLWADWTASSRQSRRAEAQAGQRAQATNGGAGGPLVSPEAGSVALGARVGEIVATGDCEHGERLAREAGDFPLAAAVRDYCRLPARR